MAIPLELTETGARFELSRRQIKPRRQWRPVGPTRSGISPPRAEDHTRIVASIGIEFPGGTAVDARVGEHLVHTDQPAKSGGRGNAPQPFDLFLASIATCAGFYALRFCERHGVDPRELQLQLEPRRDPEGKRVDLISIQVKLPAAFPAKYRDAVVRAIDQCAVKRHIVDPPKFEVQVAA